MNSIIQLNPFEYELRGDGHTLENNLVIKTHYALRDFHTIIAKEIYQTPIDDMVIVGYDENFLDSLKRDGYIADKLEAKFNLEDFSRETIYFDDNSNGDLAIRRVGKSQEKECLDVEQGYAILQKLSQKLIDKGIVSDLMKRQGLEKIANDCELKIIKEFLNK